MDASSSSSSKPTYHLTVKLGDLSLNERNPSPPAVPLSIVEIQASIVKEQARVIHDHDFVLNQKELLFFDIEGWLSLVLCGGDCIFEETDVLYGGAARAVKKEITEVEKKITYVEVDMMCRRSCVRGF